MNQTNTATKWEKIMLHQDNIQNNVALRRRRGRQTREIKIKYI